MASILSQINIDQIVLATVDGDPSTAGGVNLPVGSFTFGVGVDGMWQKKSSTITDWQKVYRQNDPGSVIKGTASLNFGTSDISAKVTIANTVLTNNNIKNITFIPQTNSDHSDLDEHALSGIKLNIENIIDNVSFDIRGVIENGGTGIYIYTYIINY